MKTAETAATWGNSYVYDPWGNLLQKNVTKGTSETLNVAVNGNNQIVGYCYDAAGNLSNAGGCGATSYAYDAEGRMAAAAAVSYDYDGAGQRVKKSGGGNDTLYWYGQSGEVLLETDLAGNLQNEYIFFNGQRVARHDLYDYVDFYVGDHLSSTRLDTDVYGNPLDDSDYYPFGGERVVLSNSSNHYKFTGLEHDSESGLDHTLFRQYSSTQGRWMTPDPAGLAASDPANPQSWNRYAYVANQPTNYIDPLGLQNTKLNQPADDDPFGHAGWTSLTTITWGAWAAVCLENCGPEAGLPPLWGREWVEFSFTGSWGFAFQRDPSAPDSGSSTPQPTNNSGLPNFGQLYTNCVDQNTPKGTTGKIREYFNLTNLVPGSPTFRQNARETATYGPIKATLVAAVEYGAHKLGGVVANIVDLSTNVLEGSTVLLTMTETTRGISTQIVCGAGAMKAAANPFALSGAGWHP